MTAWFSNLSVVEIVGWSFLSLVLLVVVFLFFYFVLRILVGWQTLKIIENNKDRGSLNIELIKTTAQIMGGLFFLFTLLFTWQNLQETKKKNEARNKKL